MKPYFLSIKLDSSLFCFNRRKMSEKIKTEQGKDSTIIEQNIDGALIKGVDEDYDWTFINDNLIEGRIPNYKTEQASDEIMISKSLAGRLQFEVNDTVRAFFVKSQPIKRLFVVTGIYDTGLRRILTEKRSLEI